MAKWIKLDLLLYTVLSTNNREVTTTALYGKHRSWSYSLDGIHQYVECNISRERRLVTYIFIRNFRQSTTGAVRKKHEFSLFCWVLFIIGSCALIDVEQTTRNCSSIINLYNCYLQSDVFKTLIHIHNVQVMFITIEITIHEMLQYDNIPQCIISELPYALGQ